MRLFRPTAPLLKEIRVPVSGTFAEIVKKSLIKPKAAHHVAFGNYLRSKFQITPRRSYSTRKEKASKGKDVKDRLESIEERRLELSALGQTPLTEHFKTNLDASETRLGTAQTFGYAPTNHIPIYEIFDQVPLSEFGEELKKLKLDSIIETSSDRASTVSQLFARNADILSDYIDDNLSSLRKEAVVMLKNISNMYRFFKTESYTQDYFRYLFLKMCPLEYPYSVNEGCHFLMVVSIGVKYNATFACEPDFVVTHSARKSKVSVCSLGSELKNPSTNFSGQPLAQMFMEALISAGYNSGQFEYDLYAIPLMRISGTKFGVSWFFFTKQYLEDFKIGNISGIVPVVESEMLDFIKDGEREGVLQMLTGIKKFLDDTVNSRQHAYKHPLAQRALKVWLRERKGNSFQDYVDELEKYIE